MKKQLIITCTCVIFSLSAFSQQAASGIKYSQQGKIDSSRLPKIGAHYQEEYSFDVSTNEKAWTTQPAALNAGFGSTEELYFRKDVPLQSKVTQKDLTGWKGERLNFQILIWSPDTLSQVRLRMNDLVNEKGNKISSNNVKFNLVRYVLSNYPYAAKDAVCGNSPYKDGYLMPDRFEEFERFELPGKTTRPVWMAVEIPANAAPGTYKGVVDILSDKHKQSLNISVKVQNKTLPPRPNGNIFLICGKTPGWLHGTTMLNPGRKSTRSYLKNIFSCMRMPAANTSQPMQCIPPGPIIHL